MGSVGLILVFDFQDSLALEAAKEAARGFANLFVLQAAPAVTSLRLGACALAKQAHVAKVQLNVRLRPAELSLRELHAALNKIQVGSSSEGVDGAQAALALSSLLQLAGTDRELAAAQQRAIVLLTDRLHEAEEFQRVVAVAQERGIGLDLCLACPNSSMEMAAGSWPDLEARHPNLTVTVVEAPCRESFRGLTAVLLERYAGVRAVPVNLQFKVPLVGDVRSLQLSARPAALRLQDSVDHAPICPCHKLPGLRGLASGACAISGEPLNSAGGRDARTIQIGTHPGGLLHFASPFNIAVGGTGQAALTVVQRVKRERVNPACMLGTPLLLSAKECHFKAMHEGELLEASHLQLLQSLAAGLRDAGELLVASSTTNLETGQAGLFKQFYAISPDAAGRPLLHATRIVTAEELPAPAASLAVEELPPALSEALQEQLTKVQLGTFDPLAFSSRCHETIEMLVMESKPMPKLQPPPAALPAAKHLPASVPPPAAAAAAGAAPTATPLHQLPPGRPVQQHAQKGPAAAAAARAEPAQPAAGKGRRSTAPKPAAAPQGKSQQGGRSGLELKRIKR